MIILDTCVVSEAIRPNPSQHVLSWLDGVPEFSVYLPSLVLGELYKGLELLPKGKKRGLFQIWLEQLRERLHGWILGFDEVTAEL